MNQAKIPDRFFALTFFVTAVYHFIGIFYQVNDSPPLRHFVFVCINLLSMYQILNKPRFFKIYFLILLVQQIYSHGNDIITTYQNSGKIDYTSFVDIIFLLIVNIYCLKLKS